MRPKTWYLGPLGDLRPLVSPDGGVSRPVERFGGVHQALSGARTMDITGHRATYELALPWLTPADSRFLEALHYRTVPGPFHLIDPMAANRLSRSAAALRPQSADLTITSGAAYSSTDAPAAVGVPVLSLDWSEFAASASATLPAVPVMPGETAVLSVWARSDQVMSVRLAVTFLGLGSADRGTVTDTAGLGTGWRRYSLAAPVPADAVTARVSFSPTGGDHIALAAAQLEAATTGPSSWDMGGGAPTVLLDQLGRESPHYPRSDFSLTLLEV